MPISFTVIIPVFNSEKTLERALKSVLLQTYSPSQIIVVDDHSTDTSPAILQEFREQVEIITSNENKGPASARNIGIENATGSHIAFLDADDFWYPEKLEVVRQAIEEHTDVQVFSHKLKKVNEEFCSEFQRDKPAGQTIFDPRTHVELMSKDDIIAMPWLGTPGVVVDRMLLDKVGFFSTSLDTGEDIDLWIRLSQHSQVCRIEQTLGIVFIQKESARTRGTNTYKNHIKILEQANQEFEINPLVLANAQSFIYENWGSEILALKEYDLAYRMLWKSIRCRITKRNIFLFLKAGVLSTTSKLFLTK
ncbi:glycosyltransferase family 2 protein [Alteromonas sp. S167]|uniref:glycosyltransferase family 2 protein n=1 Tax=Alteromonas sp. S167 TaxID=3117402 RepID=UPI002FE3B74C